jgi:hypothetical protein
VAGGRSPGVSEGPARWAPALDSNLASPGGDAAARLRGGTTGALDSWPAPSRACRDRQGARATDSWTSYGQIRRRGGPFIGIAADYLERVTALLVTLADVNHPGPSFEHSTTQARDLLATTRLLMDSPQARDPRLRALLDDLELVLAQVARLPRRAAAPDVYLIDETLDQREVLPRLRGLLAENSTSQP